MPDDKQIIALLLDVLEDVFIDRAVLMTMVMTYRDRLPQIGDWEQDFQKVKAEGSPDVKKRFAALREAVARSQNLEQALKQFLEGTSPKGPVH